MASATATAAPQVYGGDEVAAIVLDPGSYKTNIGYAGEDTPRFVLPSFYGEYESSVDTLSKKEDEGDEGADDEKMDVDPVATQKRVFDENMLYTPRAGNYQIKPILKDSLVEDWDAAIQQWEWCFKKLDVNFDEQPLLMTEPVWNTRKNKIGSMEMAFEHFKFPAFYSVKNATSISFAKGRPNCLVVDIGHDIATVTPVIDGLCLIKNSLKTHYAGNFLGQQLKQNLTKKDIKEIIPTFRIKSKKPSFELKDVQWEAKNFNFEITQSFESFQQNRVLDEMKETLLQVKSTSSNNNNNNNNNNNSTNPPAGGASSAGPSANSSVPASKDGKSKEEEGDGDEDEDDQDDVKMKEAFDNQLSTEEMRYFEMPNGLNVKFGEERFQISNTLFKPDQVLEPVLGYESAENGDIEFKEEHNIKNDYKPIRRAARKEDTEGDQEGAAKTNGTATGDGGANATTDGAANNNANAEAAAAAAATVATNNNPQYRGLSDMITNVLSTVDVDLKAHLANNIIVTGGCSLIPGLTQRLQSELVLMNPSLKIRIHAPGNMYERKYASFIGGSILASLGTFHQLWVSKQEYEEIGIDRLLLSRFK